MADVAPTTIDGFLIGHERGCCRVRPPQPQDAEAYVGYLRRNWPRFRGIMPTEDDATFDVEAHRQRFAGMANAPEQATSVTMLMFERDDSLRVVGDISFSNIVYGAFRACHLGFKIDQELEGSGIMRRALEIACDMMFVRFGLHRIMANHRPENLRSGALLKRLGFEVEGFARDYLRLDGEWRDHVLTSLVRREKRLSSAAAEEEWRTRHESDGHSDHWEISLQMSR